MTVNELGKDKEFEKGRENETTDDKQNEKSTVGWLYCFPGVEKQITSVQLVEEAAGGAGGRGGWGGGVVQRGELKCG